MFAIFQRVFGNNASANRTYSPRVAAPTRLQIEYLENREVLSSASQPWLDVVPGISLLAHGSCTQQAIPNIKEQGKGDGEIGHVMANTSVESSGVQPFDPGLVPYMVLAFAADGGSRVDGEVGDVFAGLPAQEQPA